MAATAELKAKLSLDTSLFTRGIALAESGAASLGSKFSSISGAALSAFKAASIAAVGLATAIGFGVERAFAFGKAMQEMSARTGIPISNLVKLSQVFKDAGLEADDVGLAINRMQRYIETAGAKGKLGDEFQRIKNLDPEQQFLGIAEAIRRIEDPAKRAQVAMEIFGRGGGKLLPVIMDPKLMEDAARSIGNQAALLQQNAAMFAQVAIHLEHAGVKLRGFFVGIASGLVGALEPVLERLESIDLTGIGVKFGESLVKGAQAVVGFFHDPKLFGTALQESFKAAALGLANVMLMAFKASIEFLQTGMVKAFAGIGSYILGTLVTTFAKAIAYFQAGLEAAIESITTGSPALKFQIAVKEKLRDAIGTNMAGELNAIGKGYQDDINKLKAQLATASTPIDIDKRAKEIMASGPRVGFGEGETATELFKRSSTELSEALDAAIKSLDNFSEDDVMGSGEAWKKASDAVAKAIEDGGEVVKKALGVVAQKIEVAAPSFVPGKGFTDSWGRDMGSPSPQRGYSGSSGLRTGDLGTPVSSNYLAGTSEPLFRANSSLTQAQKDEIMDQYVAQGGERPTSSPYAYHAVKAGDEERRTAFKQQGEQAEARSKLGLETTNEILKNIKTNTDALK